MLCSKHGMFHCIRLRRVDLLAYSYHLLSTTSHHPAHTYTDTVTHMYSPCLLPTCSTSVCDRTKAVLAGDFCSGAGWANRIASEQRDLQVC